MHLNRERSTCFGRGFGQPNSFLTNFVRWIVDTPVAAPVIKTSGGAGWYIVDDQSALAVDPYIVICNNDIVASADPNKFDIPNKFIRIMAPSASAGKINIYLYMWWDRTAQIGYGYWNYCQIDTVDDGLFLYDFRGGDKLLGIATNTGSEWKTFLLGDWTGDNNFIEDQTHVAPITLGISGGSDIWLTFATQAEAELFSLNKWYFLYDFDGVEQVEYAKVTEVNYPANQVKVNRILNATMAAGSVFCSYVHRFTSLVPTGLYSYAPYVTDTGNTLDRVRSIYPSYTKSLLQGAISSISKLAPDDLGNYLVDNCSLTEYSENVSFGISDLTYLSSNNDLTIMQSGRTIDLKNYIYLRNSHSTHFSAMLIADYDQES